MQRKGLPSPSQVLESDKRALTTHLVERSDTLASIALKYGMRVDELRSLNKNAANIRPGLIMYVKEQVIPREDGQESSSGPPTPGNEQTPPLRSRSFEDIVVSSLGSISSHHVPISSLDMPPHAFSFPTSAASLLPPKEVEVEAEKEETEERTRKSRSGTGGTAQCRPQWGRVRQELVVPSDDVFHETSVYQRVGSEFVRGALTATSSRFIFVPDREAELVQRHGFLCYQLNFDASNIVDCSILPAEYDAVALSFITTDHTYIQLSVLLPSSAAHGKILFFVLPSHRAKELCEKLAPSPKDGVHTKKSISSSSVSSSSSSSSSFSSSSSSSSSAAAAAAAASASFPLSASTPSSSSPSGSSSPLSRKISLPSPASWRKTKKKAPNSAQTSRKLALPPTSALTTTTSITTTSTTATKVKKKRSGKTKALKEWFVLQTQSPSRSNGSSGRRSRRKQSLTTDDVELKPNLQAALYQPIVHGSCLLAPEDIASIQLCLPGYLREYDWKVMYSTFRHGISLNTFYAKMKDSGPSLLIVEDSNHHVFGAFCSESWKVAQRYYGTGESFLFKIHPYKAFYLWTGANNYIQLGQPDSITIGGGEQLGLWLDEGLLHGASHSCDTFNNRCLASGEDFECLNMEAFVFVSSNNVD